MQGEGAHRAPGPRRGSDLKPAETLEELDDILDELDEASRLMPIIVEGLKDRMALRVLGIYGEVVVLNDGTSILHTCEELSRRYSAAIILTDWDHKGGQLARALMDAMESCDMEYDTEYRASISRIVKKDVKDVESLPALVSRLAVLSGRPGPRRGL